MLALGAGAMIAGLERRALAKEDDGAAARTLDAYGAMAPVLSACVEAGNECLAHCLDLLGKGVTELAACADSVRTMLAVCNATGVVLTSGSQRARAMLDLCRNVCSDCEAECRKHADKHPVCKKCGDACAATVAKTRALPA
jgi:Cys-rich four helix bundle protein (predicted Tat secretion target)